MRPRFWLVALLLLAAPAAFATSFIVPTDDEMVKKSHAIAIATVEGSYSQESGGSIETIYEVRIQRALKGAPRAGELIAIHTLGGVIEDRGVLVPGEARFNQGDRVLLFLNRDDDARWRTTDLTLGKFSFVVSTRGDRLLVRDMEHVVGWDHAGRLHREQVRKEDGFLRFLEQRSQEREAPNDYVVEASEVTIAAELEPSNLTTNGNVTTNAAPFPGATYTAWVSNQPVRWCTSSAVAGCDQPTTRLMGRDTVFYKRTDQNISGASDGGVSVIQSALAAWTNDCASSIDVTYGGQMQAASLNHDGKNIVEFNDPQQRIGGSWSGSGTVGVCFISFSGSHTFAGQSWLNISGADVVFQDGYPATNASFGSAMTHELGHGLGWRHSNQDYASGGACNSATQECTSAAIMNSSVAANYGFTLQLWDQHAAESVYPGGTCGPVCAPPLLTGQPQSQSVALGSPATLSVSATGTGPFTYEWFVGTSGNTASRIVSSTGSSMVVTPGMTTSYWVRVANGCGAVNSSTGTVTVSQTSLASGAAAQLYLVTPCRVVDTRGGTPAEPNTVTLVQVTGLCGIPAGARSVVMNVTAVAPFSSGFFTVYPGTGAPPPATSTVSYRTARTRANNTIMRLSTEGRVGVYNGGPTVHFLIDVTGYFQ